MNIKKISEIQMKMKNKGSIKLFFIYFFIDLRKNKINY